MRLLISHMAEEERRNLREREISSIRSSSSSDASEPSSSASSSFVAVAGDETNAQEDARNNGKLFPVPEGTSVGNSENYAAAVEEKRRCFICKNEFKTRHALYGHMRTHPKAWRGVEPTPAAAAAEQQGCDVRESAEAEQRGHNVRESAAAEQSSPVRELVPVDQSVEDVKRRKLQSVVHERLLLADKVPLMPVAPQRPQGDDRGSSENNITSDNSTAGGGSGSGNGSREVVMKDVLNEPVNISAIAAGMEAEEGAAAGVVVGVVTSACNGTLSDAKKGNSSKKKGSSSSAASGSGAHMCQKCGMTFATGQALGGHMRKHYEGPPIINKKRAREQVEEMPAPAVECRVQEPSAPIGHTMAEMAAAEERTASYFNVPLESHNPELLLRSVQASDGGYYGMNREEPEGPSAGNGARHPHDFDLNLSAEPEEEPESAAQPELERKDDDGDDAWLSLRLGHFDFRRSSRV